MATNNLHDTPTVHLITELIQRVTESNALDNPSVRDLAINLSLKIETELANMYSDAVF